MLDDDPKLWDPPRPGLLINRTLPVHRQLYQLLQATYLNTPASHPRKAERVLPTRGCVTSLINPPSTRERGTQHQRQKSLHPPAAPLVSIVGGNLFKHPPKPLLQSEHAWPTWGRATDVMNPTSGRGRGATHRPTAAALTPLLMAWSR